MIIVSKKFTAISFLDQGTTRNKTSHLYPPTVGMFGCLFDLQVSVISGSNPSHGCVLDGTLIHRKAGFTIDESTFFPIYWEDLPFCPPLHGRNGTFKKCRRG